MITKKLHELFRAFRDLWSLMKVSESSQTGELSKHHHQ